ncbi:N-acetylmuramoyl-L-alanine amidase [Streptomyces sp. NPDC008137]|uniref:N-acetylmuramoyl-L-alanine amidase n=1 Tax=Streptomyces sp. NPDC008137 TaxID=3364813 RepID=UPI0036E53C28
MKLVTRAQWGARDYRMPNGATLYSGSRRGVKLHYLGTPYADRPHTGCAAYVRQIQAQHMDGNGWSDIGYSFAVCTHGYVYEGRGLRRRNSANGSTTLNNQDYAVLLLVGSSGLTKPTDEQLHGARDAIDYCRKEGRAGTWLGGHRDSYATSCPGDAVYAWAKAGAPRPKTEEEDMPLTKTDVAMLWKTDGVIGVPADWSPGNEHWAPASLLIDMGKRLRVLQANDAAQTAAITAMANALGRIDAAVDVDALVATVRAAVTEAVESIDVRLDVADTPK